MAFKVPETHEVKKDIKKFLEEDHFDYSKRLTKQQADKIKEQFKTMKTYAKILREG